MVRSSQLGAEGTKSELILELCRAVGADTLLVGFGGSREYLDAAQFAGEGIDIKFHQFVHPRYRQCGTAPFIAGLASLDLLFNTGPQSRAILMGEAATQPVCAAA
jgi:hypothetical protein